MANEQVDRMKKESKIINELIDGFHDSKDKFKYTAKIEHLVGTDKKTASIMMEEIMVNRNW